MKGQKTGKAVSKHAAWEYMLGGSALEHLSLNQDKSNLLP